MDKLFVIAIGGTGMRCLESFIHLCAIGMFDNQTIDILTLDTDQTNGNKGRVEILIDLYNRIKSNEENKVDGGHSNTDTFFSAKLRLFRFYTNYSDLTGNSYKQLTHTSAIDSDEDNDDLSNLFFDEKTVQQFQLDHGYRAQTHLGSLLMYHSIVRAALNAQTDKDLASEPEKDLKCFVDELMRNQNSARVFVFGSIFGGTGASSIPVIPIALRDAVKIYTDKKGDLDLKSVKFGSTLLTDYFSFTSPDEGSKKNEKVIADSTYFAINSQAALQFYLADPTVKSTYRRFYHIGWPLKKLNVSNNQKTNTGGKTQENACHMVELLSACAAYDFFTLSDDKLSNETAKYFFRSIEESEGKLSLKGSDFISNGPLFENKLGSFFSLAHIILSQCEAAWDKSVKHGTCELLAFCEGWDDLKGLYNSISEHQAQEMDEYMRYFAYSFDNEKNIVKGWIYQLKQSIDGRFIFNDQAFTEAYSEMKNVSAGHLFIEAQHNWSEMKGVFRKTDNSIEELCKNMRNPQTTQPFIKQNVQTPKEKFLAHIYNAITIKQKFNLNS